MSFLQVITHNIPSFIREPLIALIGKECYTTLVWNTNFDSPYCIRYSISKILGFGIVLGGSIVKVPQIIKIVSGKSARGLSLTSYILDTAGLGITVAYNIRHEFPWSTYGENVFLLIQNVIITFLIVFYSASSNRVPLLSVFLITLFSSAFLLSSSLLTPSTLKFLAASCIPLALSSKLPQILSNFKASSTGQLSAFLVFNSLAGCLARVFTTATETKDPVLWWGFVLAAALNGILAVQMGMYWNKDDVVVKGKGKGKERLTDGDRKLEKIEISAGREKREVPVVAPTLRPTSPPNSAKRYVRKLD